MQKLILTNHQSPGDVLMLTAAVRDLHLTYPGRFLTDVRTGCPDLWAHNPYVTPLDDADPDARVVRCEYPLIRHSNRLPYHFVHGFRLFLNDALGLSIRPHAFKGDVHLAAHERTADGLPPEVVAAAAAGEPIWVVVSGGKTDYTAKWWDPDRCQAVVDHFRGRLRFVQCGGGGPDHVHPRLRGVVDLVGRTSLRDAVRLTYLADGVVCPVTMFMHLAAAVETRPGRSRNRPCAVVAGGREPPHWEAYPHHQYLHACGSLPCCDDGGCWRSRAAPLGDGDAKDLDLCLRPVALAGGRVLPRCLDLVTAADVVRCVERYLEFDQAPN